MLSADAKERFRGELRYCVHKAFAILKSDARKNYLNFAWWVLEPLLLMTVFYVVFGLLLQKGGEGFELQLIVGIVAWQWFAASITQSMLSIIRERGLIQLMPIGKWVFPSTVLLVNLIKHSIVFLLLLVLLFIVSGPGLNWFYLPVVIFAQLSLISAISYSVAAIVPFIPDLKFIITPGIQMLMFCSGVFYSVYVLPEQLQAMFLLNPIANLIEQYRMILLDQVPPDMYSLSVITLGSLGWTLFVLLMMKKKEQIYPRVVS